MYERLIILKYKHSHRAIEKENVILIILIKKNYVFCAIKNYI